MQDISHFECEFPNCGKKFTTKFSLKRHYYIHSKQKTFRCQFCSKKFALPQYLREHQYTHTNQQPFLCGVDGCEETFRQRGKLSLHRRTHQTFQKKEYRLLNAEIQNKYKQGMINDSSNQDAPLFDQMMVENDNANLHHKDSKEEVKCAQLLAENWSPLKKQRTKKEGTDIFDSDLENSQSVKVQFSNIPQQDQIIRNSSFQINSICQSKLIQIKQLPTNELQRQNLNLNQTNQEQTIMNPSTQGIQIQEQQNNTLGKNFIEDPCINPANNASHEDTSSKNNNQLKFEHIMPTQQHCSQTKTNPNGQLQEITHLPISNASQPQIAQMVQQPIFYQPQYLISPNYFIPQMNLRQPQPQMFSYPNGMVQQPYIAYAPIIIPRVIQAPNIMTPQENFNQQKIQLQQQNAIRNDQQTGSLIQIQRPQAVKIVTDLNSHLSSQSQQNLLTKSYENQNSNSSDTIKEQSNPLLSRNDQSNQ